MRAERHEDFEQMIDRGLAGAGTPEEESLLGAHVGECVACEEYLSASRRAIAGLNGFAFEAGPALNARVVAAIRMRAEQMEARRASARRWVGMSVVAVVLTVLGSVVDLRVGHWAAGFFDLRPMEVRQGLLALWIVPSFGLLLLFPILPLLAGKTYGKGRTI
jgi:predicted anti-sigma-YlaC factor YlaD